MARLTPRERREERERAEKERQLQKSIRLKAEVSLSPRIAAEPPTLDRSPRMAFDPGSIYTAHLAWCITEADIVGSWSWGEARGWTDSEYENEIKPWFSLLETSTWGDICSQHKVIVKGSSVPKHHGQEVATLIREVRDRWRELNLDQFEEAFRFRFSGTKRAWGVRYKAHFFLIWWDRFHSFYPVDKSHT